MRVSRERSRDGSGFEPIDRVSKNSIPPKGSQLTVDYDSPPVTEASRRIAIRSSEYREKSGSICSLCIGRNLKLGGLVTGSNFLWYMLLCVLMTSG